MKKHILQVESLDRTSPNIFSQSFFKRKLKHFTALFINWQKEKFLK